MKWRLLLDIEAIDFLAGLSGADEALLRRRLRQIQDTPDAFADYPEHDEHGRDVDKFISAVVSRSFIGPTALTGTSKC